MSAQRRELLGLLALAPMVATAADESAERAGQRVHQEVDQEVDQEAERLFAAVGGREAWAQLRNSVNDSQQHRLDEPVEVRAVITMDYTRPRWRIDTTAPGLRLVRVIDGERDWRLSREGRIEPVSKATREQDLLWHAGHVYRTLHRIARRDPLLQLRLGAEGRLEVHEPTRRIAWFRLNARGEPAAYGGMGDGTTVCGPWRLVAGGILHPSWTATSDGSWRASLTGVQLNVELTESLFERP